MEDIDSRQASSKNFLNEEFEAASSYQLAI